MKSGTPNIRTARVYSSPRKATKWRADVLDLTDDPTVASAASYLRANLQCQPQRKPWGALIVPSEQLPKLSRAITTPVGDDCFAFLGGRLFAPPFGGLRPGRQPSQSVPIAGIDGPNHARPIATNAHPTQAARAKTQGIPSVFGEEHAIPTG